MIYFSTLLISIFITIALIPIFKGFAVRIKAVDFPNERKVHTRPMPKTGGIAMALGALVPVIFWVHGDEFIRAVLIGAGIVVFFGLIDDLKNLGYKAKFTGQVCAALVIIFYGGVKINCLGMLLPDGFLLPDWFAIPLTLVVIVGVTNAVNLADGLDGLAGGICILIFICMSYLAYRCGNTAIAVVSAAVIGAIFGFLRFNTYPATLFMGDAGSQFLGFSAITLSLGLTQGNTPLSPLLPLILLGFPVLDTVTVMCERIVKGRSPFVADKNHFHHKLIGLGLYHTESVFVIYMLQAFLVTFAFFFRFYSEWFLLIFYIMFSCIIVSAFLITDRIGWQFKRSDYVDKTIKRKLRILKEKDVFIRLSFKISAAGIPLLLLFTCLLPANMPGYFSIITICMICNIIVIWLFKKEWMESALRLSLYLLIPFLIYLSEANIVPWMTGRMEQVYNLSFGILALFVIFTLRFTRRKKGFKSTPTDFLILFIALVVPNLPDDYIRSYHMGIMTAKIIVLLFSYEVLFGEFRKELKGLGLITVTSLLVISFRGIL